MDKYGAAAFMSSLWDLLLSAQKTVGGVPAEVSYLCDFLYSTLTSTQFIEAKKAELEKQQREGVAPGGRSNITEHVDRKPYIGQVSPE